MSMVHLPSLIKTYRIYLIALSLVVILLASILVIQELNSEKRDVINTLEGADFIVKRFDVTGGTIDTLEATGEVIYNLTSGSLPSNIEIISFEVELYNNSEKITTIEVPIYEISNSQVFDFQVSIPVENGDPSDLTSDILVNIMTGFDFVLEFTGIITYKTGLFSDIIEFNNILQFKLEQPRLKLDLSRLDMPDKIGQSNATISFDLYNPFSIDVSMDGDIEVAVQGKPMGYIDLQYQYFSPASNYVVEDVDLLVTVDELFSTYFEAISEPIQLFTSLILGFGQLQVSVSPVLELQTNGLDFQFNLSSVDGLNINYLNGEVSGVVGGLFTSKLPITLNMTQIKGELYSTDSYVGTFSWNDPSSLLIIPDHPIRLYGISFNSSVDKIPLFLNLEDNLNFKNISLTLYVISNLTTYEINI